MEHKCCDKAKRFLEYNEKQNCWHTLFVQAGVRYGSFQAEVGFCPWCSEQLAIQPVATREKLLEIAEEVIALVLRKNADYGGAWQKHGIIGCLIRISDKILRLGTLTNQEVLVVSEQIEDTLQDIIGYALLALLESKNGRSKP